jgi:SnoaL-like domain
MTTLRISGCCGAVSDVQLGVDSAEKVASLERAYRLFNERRIDDLLAMMVDDVSWPDVAHGIVLEGKPAIRQYWEAQFAVAAPQVVPREFVEVGDDLVAVIDQRIFDLSGHLLMEPAVVFHRYSFDTGLISRMTVYGRREEATA